MIKEGIVDIHTHIVPGVDDGAEDMEEALDMIRMDIKQGVRTIVATPHSAAFKDDYEGTMRAYSKLRAAVDNANLDVRIALGTEIYCSSKAIESIIQRLDKKELPTINDTRYVLIEFGFWNGTVKNILHCVDRLVESGYIPVIAHTERCAIYISQEDVRTFVDHGAKIQINLSDIFVEGDMPEWVALCRDMLAQELVTFVATDMHNTYRRYPKVEKAVGYLYENLREEYVDDILSDNAEELLFPSKTAETRAAFNGLGCLSPGENGSKSMLVMI